MSAVPAISDSVLIALIGVGGAVIGSIATVAAGLASHWWQSRAAKERDKPRRKLLLSMLRNPDHRWRNFDTLRHVVGADEDTTVRLLLELDASVA